MPDRASGFCIYNDVAVGIRWLLDQGAERVAYVDVDVHHGDGVEQIFYDDPRVLTISPARDRPDAVPRHRLPAATAAARTPRAARSTSRSRPVRRTPAGCAPSTRWCRRWCASSRPTSWSPSTAATAIATTRSPHLMLSVDGQRASYLALHDLAHEVVRRPLGGRPAAAATPWSRWSRGPGPTCWRSSAGTPLDPRHATPEAWRELRPRARSAGPRRTG